MKTLLHVLNLDTIGGVESLYIDFLRCTFLPEFQLRAQQHTVVSGKKIHPQYQARLSAMDIRRPFHEHYLMRLKVPKLFRGIVTSIRRGVIESIFEGECCWVFWNRIESNMPPQDHIYYEHGASWMTTATKKRERFVRSARKILVNSKAAKIALSSVWNVASRDIIIIQNPLRFEMSILEKPRSLQADSPIRLGYAGRLTAVKAPSLCLYAVKNMVDNRMNVTLDIAGEGTEKSFLKAVATKLGISHRVRFLGVVASMNAFYDSIDFLIIPSLREPLGLVALEASARGCPVIASCVDGLSESVAHDVSGVLIPPSLGISAHAKEFLSRRYGIPQIAVDPLSGSITTPKFLNPDDIAKAIHNIVEQPEEYTRLSRGGLRHAAQQPSLQEYTEKLLEALLGSLPMTI